MPELPEVETVCQGLIPALQGATFREVVLNRANLRFPFPADFAARVTGKRVERLDRRAKYIIAALSSGESLIMHLGMTGRFMVLGQDTPEPYHRKVASDAHIHVEFRLTGGAAGPANVHYADPRRFGFMDLVPTDGLDECRHFAGMGPEPLGDAFTPAALIKRLSGMKTPLKSALLNQKVVAGLGNIYVCEALFRARLSPRRKAGTVGRGRADRLVAIIKDVLGEAIIAGGSSLRDYSAADGTMGSFQHRFDVYDREGERCTMCVGRIARIVQSGRSTFFCANCQR